MKSGVLLVHNEQKYLPYSLNSLTEANLDELIIVLDRCTDKSEYITKRFSPNYPVHIYEKGWNEWENPIAEVAEYGFSLARGDVIFSLGADVYFDNKMFREEWFNGYDMVGFECLSWDLRNSTLRTSYEACLKKLYRPFNSGEWYGGVFGVKRKVWRKYHFQDSVYGKGRGHPQFALFKDKIVRDGFKYHYVSSTQNLAIRSVALYRENQILQGQRRATLGFPLWKILLHSFLHLKPYVLIGYLNENP